MMHMFGALRRKLKGGLGGISGVSANPADWLFVIVAIIFCCLMMLYALNVLFPDLGLAFW